MPDPLHRRAAAPVDRYRIERVLGADGMSTVTHAEAVSEYRAHAQARPSTCVLKNAHASASRSLAEPALPCGTPILPGAAR
jgi:hypothetical protein